MPDNVSFDNKVELSPTMFIRLRESKTYPFWVGLTITVGGTNTPLCSNREMKRYSAIRKARTVRPLFLYASWRSLSNRCWPAKHGNCFHWQASLPQRLPATAIALVLSQLQHQSVHDSIDHLWFPPGELWALLGAVQYRGAAAKPPKTFKMSPWAGLHDVITHA